MTAWLGRTAVDLATAVRAGEVTAREVVSEHLAAVRARNADLGALRVVRAEAALAEADQVDARPDRSGLALAGVPVVVKDNTAVAGEAVRSGSAATPDRPAGADHEVVRRLRAAGAVMLGLGAMPELGLFPMGDSAWGVTRNPWRLDRTPGGSSAGSAAAVAAGLVPAAQGNDGLGSLRIPAACCGLVALKPGRGVVPPPFGADDPWSGLAENGPLATTVADAALLFSVLAGRPEPAGVRPPERPLRVSLCTRSGTGMPVDREYRAAARTVADVLAGHGHRVRTVAPPFPADLGSTVLATWCACAAGAVAGLDPAGLERPTRTHAAVGRALRRLGLPRPSARVRLRRRLLRFFREVDLLVTPALAQVPPPAERWGERGWARNLLTASRYSPFAAPWNLAGWPAASVPAGTHSAGLPGAVQLVTPPGGEPLLLSVARLLETDLPWSRHAPSAQVPAPPWPVLG